jgi:NADH:ubiquinone oxidoreductase subunit 5 (subunit L)/multisubunit Na+/H+ antiporter MnhA subunit
MMENIYLFILFIPPVVFAFTLFIWGMDNNKRHEDFKALLCRMIYFAQFYTSLVALFTFHESYKFVFKFVSLTHYHYELMFLINKYNMSMALIFSALFILVEKLSFNYLHAEEEHTKFYGLKLFLNVSTMLFVFSTNIDFLFFNWEVVGLSSALLISYFYRRNQAVEHSLFAYSIYRFCDAAFLFSALLLFYFHHTESILIEPTSLSSTILGILFFIAIMGKSGIYPFSSWLPLALEGPTPSSNLYYMTISTHLGIVFLIKTQSIWSYSIFAKTLIILVSMINLFITAYCAKVQSTVKATIAYSALSQVSLIIIEIGFGFYSFALLHMGLHIFYRFSQMANSPSIIDHHNLIEKLSLKKINSQKAGPLYYLALQGFMSEVMVLKLFKFLLMPFIFLDILENKLFHHHEIEKVNLKIKEAEK